MPAAFFDPGPPTGDATGIRREGARRPRLWPCIRSPTGTPFAMRIAILSDIHGNLEALDACLAAIDRAGVDRIVCLGDIVGYGADPETCVDRIAGLAALGAVVVRGNHDDAVRVGSAGMSPYAAAAIAWTTRRLTATAQAFLANLPLVRREGEILYVHASAATPAHWTYVLTTEEAADSLAASDAFLTVSGHTHIPAHFSLVSGLSGVTGKLSTFMPRPDRPLPLSRIRRHHAVMGAVGQPRDGDPRAAFGILDEEAGELTWRRVPYDVDAAAAKIRRAGLPAVLATRLAEGR